MGSQHPDTYDFAGDYNLNGVILQNHAGTGGKFGEGGVNIQSMVQELNIYEGITQNAVYGTHGLHHYDFEPIDWNGNPNPGETDGGWDVAGVSNATKDHTLVRKDYVYSGNPLWVNNEETGEVGSSGTDANNSEWEVYDQNSWDHIGFHNWNPFDGPYCATDCEGVYDVSPDADPEGFCEWFNGMGGLAADCLADCEGHDLEEVQYVAQKCEDLYGCTMGDANGDGDLNVLDIVQIVGYIVEGEADFDLACADYNGDGDVNVLDIVGIVSGILGRAGIEEATSAGLIKNESSLILKANGYIGGIQMTLEHGADFSIKLSDNAWISDYATHGNQTILVMVEPAKGELFTTSGNFEVVDLIVANSNEAIPAVVIGEFSLSGAYPNPFNPTSTVELTVPEAGMVSVNVYNLTGQLITALVNRYMQADSYLLTWNADNAPSGMYLVRAEYAGQISTQKLMLLKQSIFLFNKTPHINYVRGFFYNNFYKSSVIL